MRKIKKLFFRLFTVILALFVVINLVMSYYGYQPNLRLDKDAKDGQIKVACVGDSITYGMGVGNWFKNSYPKKLGKMLGENYNVKNFGLSGATAMKSGDKPYTSQKVYKKSKDYNPDIVVIMLGSNDSKTNNWKGKEEFKIQYKELIESYINLESKPKVYLCSVSTAYYRYKKPEGPTIFKIQIDILDNDIKNTAIELAAELKINYLDVHSITLNKGEWYKFDGIHPDREGANEIAKFICNEIVKEKN